MAAGPCWVSLQRSLRPPYLPLLEKYCSQPERSRVSAKGGSMPFYASANYPVCTAVDITQ